MWPPHIQSVLYCISINNNGVIITWYWLDKEKCFIKMCYPHILNKLGTAMQWQNLEMWPRALNSTNMHSCQSTQDTQKLFSTQKGANIFSSSSVNTPTDRVQHFWAVLIQSHHTIGGIFFFFYLITGVRAYAHTSAHKPAYICRRSREGELAKVGFNLIWPWQWRKRQLHGWDGGSDGGMDGWMADERWSDGLGQMPVADTWEKLDDLEPM